MHKIKSHKTVEQIAKKHRIEVSFVKKQLEMGIPIEHEHTKDKDLATDIALQHLDEIPDYYTRLKKMEASAKKSHDKKYKDVTEAKKMKGKDPCWKGYEMIGKKMKGGKEVPNCVPVKEAIGLIRYCPRCKKEESRDECKFGVKYWDMYSVPVRLKDYTPNTPHPGNFPESKDHEYSMARSEISTIISAGKRLRKKLKGEGDIKAWIQSKITKAADYLDTAADYMDSGEAVKEDVCIQDLNGNDYIEFIDIIKPEPLKGSKTFSQFMEDWQKVNRQDKTDGLSQKAVDAYRRENPGSKLKTAVTEKNPKGKRASRRKSFCSRSAGQRDMHNIDCSKTPDKPICKARKRWRCR